ncbi:potassium channel family protein [Salarchaeum sp. JOR-1]|uniref:potassium channel family protein n=1 Tax=Salarchaeum sp. JOR-1 TaxID=2599399 RepID=UPI001198964A|nr:TrkA C-terminal domain-containing protein [Salarchaeum sp. JOR-1]QDX40711.1 potassium transporter TrkA [Salarchaeum sp. JOR-1]
MAVESGFAVQVLRGIYLGLLAGVVPVLVSFGFGFAFKYITGLTIPALGVVVLAVAVAGINGGLLAFTDQTILQSANSTTVLTALLVILMTSFYAHAQGDKLGGTLPKRISLKSIRERTFSRDVIELVGTRGRVRVELVGDIADMEGYPPLPETLRAELRAGEWTFPADLPVGEIETRLEDRLRSEFDLAAADVTLDEQARATVVAAPPVSGVSRRVPSGKRAVSVDGLVPTGVARGDTVTVFAGETTATGTVVSARSGTEKSNAAADGAQAADGGTDAVGGAATAGATTGGEGRVTVAVDRADATALLAAESGTVVVRSRGTRREFELVSLLRRAGHRIRRVSVGADSDLVGHTLAESDIRAEHGVAVLAVRHDGAWTMAPRGSARLTAGDDAFVAGSRDALERFSEVIA